MSSSICRYFSSSVCSSAVKSSPFSSANRCNSLIFRRNSKSGRSNSNSLGMGSLLRHCLFRMVVRTRPMDLMEIQQIDEHIPQMFAMDHCVQLPVGQQKFRGLKIIGQFLANGLLDDAPTGKTD